MDKKRILIFIDWYLPGYRAGGPIRSCANMIAALSSKFEFYVITRNMDYLDDKPYPDVHTDKWNVLPDGSWVHYLSKKSVNRNKIEQLLLEKNYDAIYINGIYSRFFSMIPLQLAHKHKMNAIVAPRGMLALGAMGIKPLRKRLYLQYAKSAGLFSHIRFHATGTSERDRIRKVISADAEIVLAPNLAKQVSNSPPAGRLKKSGQLRIINVARIAPEKNLHFALEILANLNGDVKMDIFGPVYNKTYWDKCLSLIADLPANIQVRHHGSIAPNELEVELQMHHLMFMPTLGENFGHAIIESMAAGCPVLISDQTPWKDLEPDAGGWALPVEDKSAFIKCLSHCVELGQGEFDRMSVGAWRYAKMCCNDRQVTQKYIQLFSNH